MDMIRIVGRVVMYMDLIVIILLYMAYKMKVRYCANSTSGYIPIPMNKYWPMPHERKWISYIFLCTTYVFRRGRNV